MLKRAGARKFALSPTGKCEPKGDEEAGGVMAMEINYTLHFSGTSDTFHDQQNYVGLLRS